MILSLVLACLGGILLGGITAGVWVTSKHVNLHAQIQYLAKHSDEMSDLELKFHNKEAPFNLTSEDCKKTADFISAVWAFTEVNRKDT